MFLRRSWTNLSPGARWWTKKHDEVCWASTSTCSSFEMSFQPFWRGYLSNLSEEVAETWLPAKLFWNKFGMKQGRCSLLSKTNRKVYQKFIRNSSNIAQVWSKQLCKWFFLIQEALFCSAIARFVSFSSKNRYCSCWCYWQCPAWGQILLCLWDCG